jgi:2'-5' RNA ligase
MYEELLRLNRKKIRFVIISVIPEPVFTELKKLSKELFELSGSITALLYPPHITIRTGAIVPIDEIDVFIKGFKIHVDKFHSQKIETEFIKTQKLTFTEYYDNDVRKNMIAYFIEKNPWLVKLNETLNEYENYKKSFKKDFNPHISLAYDDLDTANFIKLKNFIWTKKEKYLKEFSFNLSDVSLFYQNDYGYWNEFYKINL